jgi:hypothetical protein
MLFAEGIVWQPGGSNDLSLGYCRGYSPEKPSQITRTIQHKHDDFPDECSSSGQKQAEYRNLQSGIRKHKRLVSAAANAIKHQQSRIRIFSTEFAYSGVSGYLHGYFIEGIEDGTICPSTTFHHTQPVFSVTALKEGRCD